MTEERWENISGVSLCRVWWWFRFRSVATRQLISTFSLLSTSVNTGNWIANKLMGFDKVSLKVNLFCFKHSWVQTATVNWVQLWAAVTRLTEWVRPILLLQVTGDSDLIMPAETTNGGAGVPRASLICRPNSHPFQDRMLGLDQSVKVGRSVARARPVNTNAIFDCKVRPAAQTCSSLLSHCSGFIS